MYCLVVTVITQVYIYNNNNNNLACIAPVYQRLYFLGQLVFCSQFEITAMSLPLGISWWIKK